MTSFKFLTNKTIQPIREWGGGFNLRTIVYDLNGTSISVLNEIRQMSANRIECENFVIRSFRWARNFDHTQILGENYTSHIEVYEGTIGRFFDTYGNRSQADCRLPITPVIERIDYSGSSFYADTLKFSRDSMWVTITYKKFYEII